MHIYAAVDTSGSYSDVLRGCEYPALLCSFHYDPKLRYFDEKAGYLPERALTDSGAFTVWQIGESINLGEYIAWCFRWREKWPQLPTVHINLDVIPGGKGRMPSPQEVKDGMTGSLRNGTRMRKAGLPIMEVYHHLEPRDFLWRLIERREEGDLIGLSPRKDLKPAHQHRWLAGVFHDVLDRYGPKAMPPFHGLGVGSREMMFKYPFWSTDASGWWWPTRSRSTWKRDGGWETRGGTKPGVALARRSMPDRKLEMTRILRDWRDWQAATWAMWERRGIEWLR